MYLLFPVGFYYNSEKQSQAKSDVNILSWSFEMFCLGPGRLLPERGEPAIFAEGSFSKSSLILVGHFQMRERYLGGHLKNSWK